MATIQDTIQALEKKLQQAKEKARKMEAAKRAAASKAERAKDTRRKILVGAVVLTKMDQAQLAEMLGAALTRDDDRALFNLPPLAQQGAEAA